MAAEEEEQHSSEPNQRSPRLLFPCEAKQVLTIHGIFSSAGAVPGNDGALFTKESTSIMVGPRFGESHAPGTAAAVDGQGGESPARSPRAKTPPPARPANPRTPVPDTTLPDRSVPTLSEVT